MKLVVDAHDASPQSGVAGDPTVASKEKGKAIFDAIVQEISKFLEEFYML